MLLKDLGCGSDVQSMSLQEYKRKIGGVMGERVLVIVDDIDAPKQFEDLVPDIGILQPRSRVVITSRQWDVLNHAMRGASLGEVFEVLPLNKMNSRHLFNLHAFLSETPGEGYGDLAAEVADACKGHALSLEIMGASLFNKKEPEEKVMWTEAIKALEENEEVFGKLRSSYDRLPSDGDRMMFLDIACMLIGLERVDAMRVWELCKSCGCGSSSTPVSALRRLMDRSLVKVDKYGRFRMHDVLRDMGRDMIKKAARGAEEWSYVWDGAMARKVLKCGKKNTSVRGIRLDNVDNAVPGGFSNWPRQLRWLRWRRFPWATLPSQLNMPWLVVLDLSGSDQLRRLWKDHAYIQLPLLETLDLSWCRKLEELGEDVGLEQLPEQLGKLTNLETINVMFCSSLCKLPTCVGGLKMLKTLKIWGTKVEDLPTKFGLLSSLTTLELPLCLQSVSKSFQRLPAFTYLELRYGTVVLGNLGALTALKVLDLSCHKTMTILPKSVGNLKLLVQLHMWGCKELLLVEALPEGLERLHLQCCSKLTKIPSLAGMRSLIFLDMRDCSSLKDVYGLECVPSCHLGGSKLGVAYNNKWLEVMFTLWVLAWSCK